MGHEMELNTRNGDAFLLAGQQNQRAGIGGSGAARVQGARPQPGMADGCDLGSIDKGLAD